MKKIIAIIIILVSTMPIASFSQSYSALWKQANYAEENDLPKTQYEVMQKIVKKAEREKAYGQLLKAELLGTQVMSGISPDSLKPAVERIRQRSEGIKDPVLKIVYQTVLWRTSQMDRSLTDDNAEPYVKPELTEALCEQLAAVKDETYEPFVVKGVDSRIFDHDLLSIVGFELEAYRALHDYYDKSGNRQAACITALKMLQQEDRTGFEDLQKSEYLQALDSVIQVYADLDEAGELAIEHYDFMENSSNATAEDKIRYIHYALGKWGNWPRMNELRNAEKRLTNSEFSVEYGLNVMTPQTPQTVKLKTLRNISNLKMTVYGVKVNGDTELRPDDERGYKKIKALLTEPVAEVERKYIGKAAYEFFEDTLQLEGLPVGVYMLEFSTSPATEVVRRLYYVTDVYTIAEAQPGDQIRYVVVSAKTGQPIAKAHLRIRQYTNYSEYDTIDATTDDRGEYLYKYEGYGRREVFAYTDKDKACPEMSLDSRYNYYKHRDIEEQTEIYTDRAIYRPGQTVHAAIVIYNTIRGFEHAACDQKGVRFTLRDANRKVVAEKTATTDKYGTCACEFTLPASGLTGNFSIQANGKYHFFRVEEYKRPTFEVTFPTVNQHYEEGDTVVVRATARSYAGVPVQGASVQYKVVRRTAYWWLSYSRYWGDGYYGTGSNDEEIYSGETTTEADGTFPVEIPMKMPKSSYPLFYNFVAMVDVTDAAGETHSGQISLPLGNRKTALSVDLSDKFLAEENPTTTFHLRNAAGNDIDADVSYSIDDGKWQTVKTTVECALGTILKSGRHTLKAVCGTDTIERSFVIFSLADKRPAVETDDWFYVSHSQFPNDGKPVTLQVGSSDKDVHIVYSIFSGEKVIESGAVDKSNELINRQFTYKEEWGNSIFCTFAWVKQGKCYTHTASIRRPLPDKHLQLQWTTFRDRLTPGQQEEWTLTVTKDGKPVDALLMATMYDKSLDQLKQHGWSFVPYVWLATPHTNWACPYRYSVSFSAATYWSRATVKDFDFSHFDDDVYPANYFQRMGRRYSSRAMMVEERMLAREPMMAAAGVKANAEMTDEAAADGEVLKAKETVEEPEPDTGGEQQIQIRENLNETAFFYPQLTTDAEGRVALKFTLPESLTTWRFMGLAHTADMYYGSITGETVAKKDVMVQPNMPRFIREGDEAVITARIFNTSEKEISGTVLLKLLDPETEKVVYEQSQPFDLGTTATTTASFNIDPAALSAQQSLLICQVVASGQGFSDGEQHYLPVLPSRERVTVTVPFTQIQPGKKVIDLANLIPADGTNGKLTVEYTNNPAWLMIQALPVMGKPIDDDAVSQAASYYANSLGKYIIDQNPKAKTAFKLWQEEGDGISLTSALEKNQELKDILLNETPWVMAADRETEQKHRLVDFFDSNLMGNRLSTSLDKLKKLQLSDGSWTWWPGMPGSFYMTVTVSEMLVRLNSLTGTKSDTRKMLSDAFRFMGREIVIEVESMKKAEKKGYKPSFPSFKALQWLYLCTLDGRELPADVQDANNYLMPLLKKDVKRQSIYEKAMTAVILSKTDPARCKTYVKSLKEYTVYREDMGRYYDTPRAGYSWCDYRIPTQTMAIEALQRLTPDDRQTILEMQRWLLQEKRAQAWSTSINSANAVYAFLEGNSLVLDAEPAAIAVDEQPLETSKATAAIGYVKGVLPDAKAQTLTVDKTSEGVSWGAVYAQFVQPTSSIADSGSGIKVKREILKKDGELKVGDRVTVRITIETERDLDFVQLLDRRAACMEPVRQLSGYYNGAYCAPRDNTTNYYFHWLPKGKRIVETEYYIDRPGTYETGTCTVQCAYAPEFRATTKSQTLIIK